MRACGENEIFRVSTALQVPRRLIKWSILVQIAGSDIPTEPFLTRASGSSGQKEHYIDIDIDNKQLPQPRNMTHRTGFRAALALGVIGVIYAGVVAVGIIRVGLTDPIVDPTLGVMEVLTLMAAPVVVILMAAVYDYAAGDRKTYGLIALAFGILMAGLTSGVHFVALTAGRQTGTSILQWPSTSYALELLAWDMFLGLALLFASAVFQGSGVKAVTRRLMVTTGVLCLLGTIGPALGDMRLQRIGILGYGVFLPLTCFFVAFVFRREEKDRT